MKRLNQWSVRAPRIALVIAAAWVLCSFASSSDAADNNDKSTFSKKLAADQPYGDTHTPTNFSSASASSSSSSQSDSNGRTRSRSEATATATGNAASSAAANGQARSLRKQDGQAAQKNRAASSARAKAKGDAAPTDRYPNLKSPQENTLATSTATVVKNGIKITRSIKATDEGTVTTLDVVTKTDELSVLDGRDGSIEVRVRDRNKNAAGKIDEQVYSAASRDELRKQSPKLVRKIEAFEKIAGTVRASVDPPSANAFGKTADDPLQPLEFGQAGKAKQMMKQQLENMLQQNPDNPELQKMIRKLLDQQR
ncbi:hypothetical protein TBK1r_37230 [Stieleria magnilauensis]|uniref:Uncharacterized protein n=2 Tax=Stieleria magnilauensis TaxID=2527963 RepID=A0ABX5XTZ9_9BACT|nr:hypothetical protein TBK1r_37230 [Planctomycetes bacterium TBK1r]